MLNNRIKQFIFILSFLITLSFNNILFAEFKKESSILIPIKELDSNSIKKLVQEANQAYKIGAYQKAISIYKKIISFEESSLGLYHKNTANSINALGIIYYDQGSFEKAKELFKKSLNIRKKIFGENHLDTANIMHSLALVYYQEGLYDKTILLLQKALKIKQNIFDPKEIEIGTSLEVLGTVYISNGKYKIAEEYLLDALDIYNLNLKSNDSKIINILNNLASLADAKGLYKKAKLLHQEVLEKRILKFGFEHRDVAQSLNNIGAIYAKFGQINKAEANYKKAIEISENLKNVSNIDKATFLNNLASLYSDMGLYEKAEPLYLKSIQLRKSIYGDNHNSVALSLNNLARNFENQNFDEKAESLYNESLLISEKVLGPDHPLTLSINSNLAALYLKKGSFDIAKNLNFKVLKSREKVLGFNHLDVATSLSNLGNIYYRQGLFSEAEPFYLKALEISKINLGLINLETNLFRWNLASNYFRNGDIEDSIDLFDKYIRYEIEYINQEIPYLEIYDRKPLIDSFRNADFFYTFALTSREGIKLAINSRLNNHGILEEIEKKQLKLSNLAGNSKDLKDSLKETIKLISSRNIDPIKKSNLIIKKGNLERKLFQLIPEMKSRFIELEQITSLIPSNSVLIEFQRYYPYFANPELNINLDEPRYIAFIIKPNNQVIPIDLGLASNIEKKILQALVDVQEGLIDQEKSWNILGEMIIQPIEEIIDQEDTLFISPDGEINRVPFALLKSSKNNNYLAESYNLRLLTTGRELIELNKKISIKNRNPLVVANPNFDKNKFFDQKNNKQFQNSSDQVRSLDLKSKLWSPLPGTIDEGKEISNLLKTELIDGDKATVLSIQDKKKPKLIHIASHSYYLPTIKGNEDSMLRSGIVLAGANNPEFNSSDDGYLTSLEITKLDWDGTQLVVISGCESGKGDILNGEGVYGLKRAIAVAGARSSLLSLWKVDDEATAAFMKSFYKKLIIGKGRADALAQTQKEFRNHSNKKYNQPYVWAAFQLSGDWRPIDF